MPPKSTGFVSDTTTTATRRRPRSARPDDDSEGTESDEGGEAADSHDRPRARPRCGCALAHSGRCDETLAPSYIMRRCAVEGLCALVFTSLVTLAHHVVATYVALGLGLGLILWLTHGLPPGLSLWPSLSAEFEVVRFLNDHWGGTGWSPDVAARDTRQNQRMMLAGLVVAIQFLASMLGTAVGASYGDSLRLGRSEALFVPAPPPAADPTTNATCAPPVLPSFADASVPLGTGMGMAGEAFLMLVYFLDVVLFINQHRAASRGDRAPATHALACRVALHASISLVIMPMVRHAQLTTEVAQLIVDRGIGMATFWYRVLFRLAAVFAAMSTYVLLDNI